MFRSDVLVVVASANEAGVPEIVRAAGLRRHPGEERCAVYVPVPEGLALLGLVAERHRIAVTVGRPRDYRSLQIKSSDAVLAAITREDEEWTSRYRRELAPAIEASGVPRHVTERLFSPELVSVHFTPEGVWDQTPGRSAGHPLTVRR